MLSVLLEKKRVYSVLFGLTQHCLFAIVCSGSVSVGSATGLQYDVWTRCKFCGHACFKA